VLLLIAQSLLIGRHNRRLHETLGWSSVGLVAFLLITSAYMVWIELVGEEPFPTALRLKLVFLDVALLTLFVAAYAMGLINRRRPAIHARLMGSTLLVGLGPALGRLYAQQIPAVDGLAGAIPWMFWTIEAILVAAIAMDVARGKVHWPFPAMLAAFVLVQIGMNWASGPTFAAVARSAGAPI